MKKQKYSKVFKERTLQLCAEQGSVSEVEVCKELGLRSNMVYRWRREQEEYGTRSFPGQGHDKGSRKSIGRARGRARFGGNFNLILVYS